MKRDDWTVGQEGVRPAGKPGHCTYCQRKVGDQHKPDCVIRSRTVVVQMTFEVVLAVPEDWDRDMIEFAHNDSSSCYNNRVSDLVTIRERMENGKEQVRKGRGCMCSFGETKFIREATEEDEAAQALYVKDLPA